MVSRLTRLSFLVFLLSVCFLHLTFVVRAHDTPPRFLDTLVFGRIRSSRIQSSCLAFRLYSRSRHRRLKPTGDKLSHLCFFAWGSESKRIQLLLRSTSYVSQWFANCRADSVFYIRTTMQRHWLRRLRACCGLMWNSARYTNR